jgi:SAM-dependent methyltransferase
MEEVMDVTRTTEQAQAARWNGTSGHAWVDAQAVLDDVLRPFETVLVDAVRAAGAHRVLDVGCGTGGTTVAVAGQLGPGGVCVGVDISGPMVAAARERAARDGVPVRFVHADAQDHAFDPGGFDMVISRFGVMFFDDAVRAFANLRRAAQPGAALRCVAWRAAEENPFMTTAERAAAPLLPDLPARRPDEPGQFALADPDRVRTILADSGWHDITVEPLDVPCALPESELVGYFTRFGALGPVLPTVEEPLRTTIVDTVRAAFDPYVHGAEVRIAAACWTIGARA